MRARDSVLNVRWGIICTPTRMMASDGKLLSLYFYRFYKVFSKYLKIHTIFAI